jgi:SAM-dependent methyltransferase
MIGSRNYQATAREIVARWPYYGFLLGGIVLSLVGMLIGAANGLPALVPFGTALLILLLYFLVTALWETRQLHDENGLRPHIVLHQMAQLKPWESFVFMDLASRELAIDLAQTLTTGCIFVVNVYNPQWTNSRTLARRRKWAPGVGGDPRLEWYSSELNLLPFPDGSVRAVMLCEVLSEFRQHGDRIALLKEAVRVLAPDGKVVVAERARSQMNWLLKGPAAYPMLSRAQWRALLVRTGLRVTAERDLYGLIHCFSAERSAPPTPRQLSLELVY